MPISWPTRPNPSDDEDRSSSGASCPLHHPNRLARLYANKQELLVVLDRPEVPLHTNGTENDVRCQVTRRKISGGTRSHAGKLAKESFLGLMKTCEKLGISFWDYLGHRLNLPDANPVPALPELIRQRQTELA